MNSTNTETSGPTGPDDTIGCIGFDTLNIPSAAEIVEKRISRKLKIMVSITTACCSEFIQFIVGIGRANYKSSGERGAVTFTIHEDDFDDTFRKIHKCYDIFSDPEHKDMDDLVKINLMEHTFPAPLYYSLDNKHLKTAESILMYSTYNPNNSAIIFIGMSASGSDHMYSHIGTVSV
jgi:hypothetical protein